MPDIDVKIQWHSPDQAFAAVFVRDGEPWYLNGALVGMDSTPGEAVTDLLGIAQHLVLHGENFLTEGVVIPLEDRKWLFSLLDQGGDFDQVQTMYEAIRRAEEDEPYRTKTGKILTEAEIQDLADEAERGYCVEPGDNGKPCFKPLPCPVHEADQGWDIYEIASYPYALSDAQVLDNYNNVYEPCTHCGSTFRPGADTCPLCGPHAHRD